MTSDVDRLAKLLDRAEAVMNAAFDDPEQWPSEHFLIAAAKMVPLAIAQDRALIKRRRACFANVPGWPT